MNKRLVQGGVALAAAFLLLGWMTRDLRLRSAMVGRWNCSPYYAGNATLYFLRDGRYAEFEKIAGSDVVATGSWDVVNGELLQIVDHTSGNGGATYGRVELDWTTLRISDGKAQCRRIEGD